VPGALAHVVPPKARRGEIVEVKTLASHVMETGYRRDINGIAIPCDLVRAMRCTYNGEEVFSAEFHPAMAANPYVAFTTVATESGTLDVEWTGDNGYRATASARLEVE